MVGPNSCPLFLAWLEPIMVGWQVLKRSEEGQLLYSKQPYRISVNTNRTSISLDILGTTEFAPNPTPLPLHPLPRDNNNFFIFLFRFGLFSNPTPPLNSLPLKNPFYIQYIYQAFSKMSARFAWVGGIVLGIRNQVFRTDETSSLFMIRSYFFSTR